MIREPGFVNCQAKLTSKKSRCAAMYARWGDCSARPSKNKAGLDLYNSVEELRQLAIKHRETQAEEPAGKLAKMT